MAELEDGLDGNLCRCTGYRPILDAAKSFGADSDIEDCIGTCGGGKLGGCHVAAPPFPPFLQELRAAERQSPRELAFSGSGRRWQSIASHSIL